jgi:hypothetical protein
LDNIKTSLVQLSQASQMSKDQLDSFFKQLEKDTKTVLSGSAEKAAIKLEKSWDDRLDKMVVRLDKFRKQVTDELQFGQQLKETVRGLGSVATATEGIGQTFFGIQNHLRAAVTNSQEFYKVLKKLDDAGLNDTSISQLAAAGPAALANAQALLSGGPQGIKSINALQGQLDSAGNSIANKTADNFYRAGQSISDGLLKGIQSKQKQLENQMDALGKKAAASFKKALGIHSPSRVMHGLGMNVTDGLANGIIAGSRKVERASAGMGGQVVFGAGSVVVSADGREPMHAGTMAGKGITSVLERQRAQSALRGLR